MSIFLELWHNIPPITRTLLLISLTLSLMVSLELCTPYKLYFNYQLIINKGQYWRAFTSLFYYGEFTPTTIWDCLIFYWYSSKLENHDFRSKPAEFIIFVLFSCTSFLIIAMKTGL